ncbi:MULTISPECIES: hypothetical protein [Pseudomonas]|uniref:Polynucleotide kinase n=1 Tax=Pseudomonas lutea TaxID=243924 RepID=A0A9X8QM20_9PSED|nr:MULTISPECIES: hypothetical protein [Pseudomonas]SER48900.1 hypothetical protein SAMN05216409_1283 [Pseudomonas lutea]
MGKWIGVDLDGTLAESNGKPEGTIGKPLKPMLDRVQEWVQAGQEVRIFTARADSPLERLKIQRWLEKYGLGNLAVTNKKDWEMQELWDDRAIRMKPNKGEPCGECEGKSKFSYSCCY